MGSLFRLPGVVFLALLSAIFPGLLLEAAVFVGRGTYSELASPQQMTRNRQTVPGSSKLVIQKLKRRHHGNSLENKDMATPLGHSSSQQYNKHDYFRTVRSVGWSPALNVPGNKQNETLTAAKKPTLRKRSKTPQKRQSRPPPLRTGLEIPWKLPLPLPKRPKSPRREEQAPKASDLVSPGCSADRAALSVALLSGETWAQKMADSSGHVGAGMLNLELDFVGIREECVSAATVLSESGLRFHAQYCVASLVLKQVPYYPEFRAQGTVTGLSVGLCVPSTCNTRDVTALVLASLRTFRPTEDTGVEQVHCSSRVKDDAGRSRLCGVSAGVLTFLCLWSVLVLVCTAIHRFSRGGTLISCQSAPRSQGNRAAPPQAQRPPAPRRVHYRPEKGRRQRLHGSDQTSNNDEDSSSGMVKIEFNIANDVVAEPPPRASLRSFPRRVGLPRGASDGQPRRGILRGESVSSLLRSAGAATRAEELSGLRRLVACFSLEVHARKLLDTSGSRADTELRCLHGVRVLSLAWVLLSHCVLHHTAFIRNAIPLIADWRRHRLLYALIGNGQLGFESLFTVSGLSVGYAYSQRLDRQRGGMNWGAFLLTRYWRIVPSLLVVSVVSLTLLPDLLTGPLTLPNAQAAGDGSLRQVWMTALLVHNFSSASHRRHHSACLGWTWFLAADFQLFLLTPVVLLLLYRRPRAAFLLVSAVVVACCLTSGVLTHLRHLPIAQFLLPGDPSDNVTSKGGNVPLPLSLSLPQRQNAGNNDSVNADADAFAELYFRTPWAHAGSFYPALLLGHVLHRYRRRASLGLGTLVTGWLTAFAVSMAVLFGPATELTSGGQHQHQQLHHHHQKQYGESSGTGSDSSSRTTPVAVVVYNAVHGTAWSLALCWLVLVCSTGHSVRPLSSLLSWSGWKPLSRLLLGVYLLFPLVMAADVAGLGRLPHFTGREMLYAFLGVSSCSLLLSLALNLVVERPANALLASAPCCSSSSRPFGSSTVT